jgi:cell wall-associated NlpC family hydrolase
MSPDGIDCSGLSTRLYSAVAKTPLPRTSKAQSQIGTPVSADALRSGDLVFFNYDGVGVSHVGVSLGGDEFVHASSKKGVIISNLRQPWYWDRYLGARRIPQP